MSRPTPGTPLAAPATVGELTQTLVAALRTRQASGITTLDRELARRLVGAVRTLAQPTSGQEPARPSEATRPHAPVPPPTQTPLPEGTAQAHTDSDTSARTDAPPIAPPWARSRQPVEARPTPEPTRSTTPSIPMQPPEAAPGDATPSLEQVRAVLGDCTRCPLHQRRKNLVFGVGNPKARLMFIGEAPGEQEDRRGEPFVGPAGELLTKMIQAMGLQREDVYIANVLKCRPPDNRDPQPAEVEQCLPFLREQIAAVRPEVIVTLGRHATVHLLGTNVSLTRVRGTWLSFDGIPIMPTWHPSYLLRKPEEKRSAWHDLQIVMDRLGLKRS